MSIELQTLRKNHIYTAKATVSSVMADLQEIAGIDRLAELQQSKHGKRALYYFLAIIGALLLIVVLSILKIETTILGLGIILLLLGIFILTILLIYELFKKIKFGRLNVINYRYEVTQRVVQMLARDIDESSEIELTLSFKPTVTKENKAEIIPHLSKTNWKIDKYQHEWLRLKGQFLDKTRFLVTATELSKTQYGWKRGRSGKSKYKSKRNSVGLDVVLNLNYPQRRYGAVKILQNEVSNAVKLPNLSYMKGLKVTEKAMYMIVRIAPQVADNSEEIYQTITMMFLSFYQVLNLAKVLSKESR
ncbi:MAG: hypothetical protein RMX68_016415 [Aulosira sp. ZfuVER01]|nr:hypothetical protein [Aulosira sp. ZfuVER01]MDZ8002022.1 hypothetical protein [Aulosira sp. DedVER01a]MDZ8054900.1 hypothetical protein [Aulosira sp. ZfuCHP01]